MALMNFKCLILCCGLLVLFFYPIIDAQLIPFVNCTINDGTTCLTTWGYSNSYPNTYVLPLFRNKFSPAPIFRGQPTVFQASTTVYKAFNTTRPCSSGSLTWSLTDPVTNTVNSATSTNATGDSCTPQPPLIVDCINNTIIAERLKQCTLDCGSQCPYCGQVYSFCEDAGLITANFTLDNCIIIGLGFRPTSSGCAFETVLDNCCQNVGPPIAPPVTPPPTCNADNSLFYQSVICIQSVLQPSTCNTKSNTCNATIALIADGSESLLNCLKDNGDVGLNITNAVCIDRFELNYQTCCGLPIPYPTPTPVCPNTEAGIRNVYNCIENLSPYDNCFGSATFCTGTLGNVANNTDVQSCISGIMSRAASKDNVCDLLEAVEFCCNDFQVNSSTCNVQTPFAYYDAYSSIQNANQSIPCIDRVEDYLDSLLVLANYDTMIVDCFVEVYNYTTQLICPVELNKGIIICCNGSVPLIPSQPNCPSTQNSAIAFSCVDNPNQPNCATKVASCTGTINTLGNSSTTDTCLTTGLASSVEPDCEFFQVLETCCNA